MSHLPADIHRRLHAARDAVIPVCTWPLCACADSPESCKVKAGVRACAQRVIAAIDADKEPDTQEVLRIAEFVSRMKT